MCTKEQRWKPTDGTNPDEERILMSGKIKELRALMLSENDGLCDLCGLEVERDVLDHSHRKDGGTGCVRAAICNSCNRRLARVENNWRARMDPLPLADWMKKAGDYIERHHLDPSNIVHPVERVGTKKRRKKAQK